jgi:predicted transcriptional regulator
MEKEDARKQSREVLQERRKQVIRLHRKGVGVMQIVEQTGLSWSGVNAALRLFEQGGAAALKPPPSPPALIQQHLIAGEPQFQSCAQMDKPSRVGYGLHRRNTQPAKSARYWSASTCFTRWTFISTWQTSPISSCAATRADLSPGRPQPEPRSKSQRAPWRSHAFFGIACSPPQTS